jgi:CRP/FNR family transcriptional regulator
MSLHPALYGYIRDEWTYPKGAVLMDEGGRGEWVYVILEGKAKVVKKTAKGKLTLQVLTEGDFFGEMAFLGRNKGPRSASVVAVDGSVRVGMLDPGMLERDYEMLSPQIKQLIRSLIMKLIDADQKASELAVAAG